jgi:hypothetical protein
MIKANSKKTKKVAVKKPVPEKKGYSGRRWVRVNGGVELRQVYVFGDVVFAINKSGSGSKASIVDPKDVFETQAAANGGEDKTVFVVHSNGREYKPVKARRAESGEWFSVVGDSGRLLKIYGTTFEKESEAAAYCLKHTVGVLQEAKRDHARAVKAAASARKNSVNRRRAARF